MKKILNVLFLTIITLVTFSCSDVPAPYDINEGGGNGSSLEGEGTKENPYTVADAIRNQDGSVAWVKGYIVGLMGNKYKPDGQTFDGNIPVFEPPFTITTNVLIAASADETNIKNCLPVKMKGGSVLSIALNLKDHPANLGQALIIKGQLSAGFGASAMIETTAAVFDGKDIGEGGTEPEPPTGTVLFEETFKASQGAFTISDKALPEGSAFVWQWSSFETSGYMKASAFINQQNKAAESWLISPTVDLTKSTDATLVFDHAWKFAADKTAAFTLWVSEAGKDTWAQVTIPNYSDGASWTFVSSGNIGLKSYVGKNIQFAFKYTSTAESAGMWEVKNVKVLGDGSGANPNPPVEGNKVLTETFGTVVTANTNVADYKGWDNASLTFNVSDPKVNLRAIAHKTEANKVETQKVNHIWFPIGLDGEFTIGNINAAGYEKFVLNYEMAANTYDLGSTIDLNVLKVTFDNTDLVVPSKIVTATVAKDDANIFYEMQVEIKVAGTATSALKFSAASSTNLLGLRLTNVRLVGVENGGTDPAPSGTNLIVNSGLESWTEAALDGWNAYGVFGKEATIKHGGELALKYTGGKNASDLKQDVAVVAGKKYKISYWYLDNDANAKTRIWSSWVDGSGVKTKDDAAVLQPVTYSNDNPEWQQFTATLVAPATAAKFTLLVRTYNDATGGGYIYYDDFEIVEVE